jgi:HNH endonuclease
MATRRKIPIRVRRQVIARAQYRCEYCLLPEDLSLDTFTIDHIQPVSDAGSDDLDNLAFACHNCNNRKNDDMMTLDVDTGQRVPFYHPRRDHWTDHFEWSDDALTILPLSAIGRVTVSRFRLYRGGAVNVRRALIALGEEHPPRKID